MHNHFCKAIELEDYSNDLNLLGVERSIEAIGAKYKFWPNGSIFKVGFIGGDATNISLVKQACAEWSKYANVTFIFPTSGPYDCRAAFVPNNGSYSYIGTDNRNIPQNQPTMNLGWKALDAALHEFGHFLGLLHEHQRKEICYIPANVYKDLEGTPNYWDKATIDNNVLIPPDPDSIIFTPLDRIGIMEYPVPGSWCCDGIAIPGGKVLSDTDKSFIGQIYPFAVIPPINPPISVTLTALQIQDINKDLDIIGIYIDTLSTKYKALRAKLKTLLGQ